MRTIQLVDSSFRAPHFPDAAETRLCLGRMILRIFRGGFPANLSPRAKADAEVYLNISLNLETKYTRIVSIVTAVMNTFLSPIEKPDGLMKLAYYFTRRQFGKVLTPLKVHNPPLPPPSALFYTTL